MLHSYVCHDSFIRDMTNPYVNWFNTELVHTYKYHSYVCHDSFTSDMTHLYVNWFNTKLVHACVYIQDRYMCEIQKYKKKKRRKEDFVFPYTFFLIHIHTKNLGIRAYIYKTYICVR